MAASENRKEILIDILFLGILLSIIVGLIGSNIQDSLEKKLHFLLLHTHYYLVFF